MIKAHPRTRRRKVYYGYYPTPESLPHPVIRLGGKYLKKFGFVIGDTIEVLFTRHYITIKKVSPPFT